MTSTITCSNCQDEHSTAWSKTLSDGGLYTYCPNCLFLDWIFPPELSPNQQEGFPTEFRLNSQSSSAETEDFINNVRSLLDPIGCKFEYEPDEPTGYVEVILGMVQKELTSWPFDPDEEDSDGNAREQSRLHPDFLDEIIQEALAELNENYGADGWESTREFIAEKLSGVTFGGVPVEVIVGPGEWTGKG